MATEAQQIISLLKEIHEKLGRLELPVEGADGTSRATLNATLKGVSEPLHHCEFCGRDLPRSSFQPSRFGRPDRRDMCRECNQRSTEASMRKYFPYILKLLPYQQGGRHLRKDQWDTSRIGAAIGLGKFATYHILSLMQREGLIEKREGDKGAVYVKTTNYGIKTK